MRKILVTYASRSGSTAGIAEAIGHTLTELGHAVDVRPMTEVHDTSDYVAIVAGSAVRQEKWLPEAVNFMETHQHDLRQKPVATFLVCMALATDDPDRYNKGLASASTWMQPVRELVQPVSEGMFAGVLDISKVRELPFRIVMRGLVLLGFWSEGDYRDWDKIEQWAITLPKQLVQPATV